MGPYNRTVNRLLGAFITSTVPHGPHFSRRAGPGSRRTAAGTPARFPTSAAPRGTTADVRHSLFPEGLEGAAGAVGLTGESLGRRLTALVGMYTLLTRYTHTSRAVANLSGAASGRPSDKNAVCGSSGRGARRLTRPIARSRRPAREGRPSTSLGGSALSLRPRT